MSTDPGPVRLEGVAALQQETEDLAAHLRLALDAGGFGTWRWNQQTGVTEWDEEMERLCGLEPGSFDGTFDAWAEILHPDDRAAAMQVVEDAVQAKGHYRLEHRVITPTGEVRWLEGAGRVTLDPFGNVTGTIGCCHDISDRAEAERERERLAAIAEDSLQRETVQRERLELVAAVNEVLEEADDLEALMAGVTQAVVPRLGDWCSIYVFETETSKMPLVETSHRDPDMVRYARELQARYPFDPDAPAGIAAVIRTGRSEFHPFIDEELIQSADVTVEQQDIIRDLALRSAIAVSIHKRGRAFGAMQFVMSHGHRSYTQEDVTLAEAIAARIAATLDNRRLRGESDRTASIDAALAHLGRRLAASATLEQVVEVIVDDAPGVLGAHRADIGLALDAENLTLVGAARRVLSLSDAGSVATALIQAETILSEEDPWVSSEEASSFGRDGGALVASPLYDDAHQPMGVLVLTWPEPRQFDEVDVNAVETLSRLCGQSIVRSQLAGNTEALARLAASMAAARSTTEVARLLHAHGTSTLGATIANLRLLDRESETLVPVLPSPLPDQVAQNYERLSVRSAVPLSEAARDDTPVWLPDIGEIRRRFPEVGGEAAVVGVGATAAIPLHDSDGVVVGAVAFAWPNAMRFDARFRSRLATLCDLAAQTLERVRLFEAEHAVVVSMQRQLLAPLPTVDGLELAAFYEPAAATVGMGGDWYEALALDDGSAVAIIGDVVGHGVQAIAAMAQIQHLLTGLIRAGTPLSDVLAVANAMTAGPELTNTTALLLHLDPVGGRVGYSSAGHPWALLRHPDGCVEKLDGNQHPMFGQALGSSELVYVPMKPGAMVLVYTDGLVERRGESIDDGIDRLASQLDAFAEEHLHEGLLRLVGRVQDADPSLAATTDDIAAMAIRMVGISADASS